MKEKMFHTSMTSLDESLDNMNIRIGGRLLSDGRKIISVFSDPEHKYHAIAQEHHHISLESIPEDSSREELQEIIKSYESTNNLRRLSEDQWKRIQRRLGIEETIEKPEQTYEHKKVSLHQRVSQTARIIKDYVTRPFNQRKKKKFLSSVVNCYNSSRSYQRVAEELNLESKLETKKLLQEALEQYEPGKSGFQITTYDNNIASDQMRNTIVDKYCHSEKNLKILAKEISEEYGMNISSSTISKYARKKTGAKNRKEARKKAKKS